MVAAPDWIQQKLAKPLEVSQLLAQPLIAYDEDLPLVRQYFEEVFETTIKAQAAITVADLRTVRQLVTDRQGYSVFPQYLCIDHLQQSRLALVYEPKRFPTKHLYLA